MVDEAYLDVSDCTLCKGSATLIAQKIREDIFYETGLTASAGIAPIKFLAKIASDENKPNGQFVIPPHEVQSFIDALPLRKIPGVGKVTYEKLLAMGLEYGKDVKAFDQLVLVKQLGKFGAVLWQRCNGLDSREVVTERVRKSVGVETTFETDLIEPPLLHAVLTETLLPELEKRLINVLKTRTISKLGVKVKYHDFQQTTKECQSHKLDSEQLAFLLNCILEKRRNKPVRLLGLQVGLNEVDNQSGLHQNQLGLF
ncbi:DNA polymerase IV [Pseudoalteromonas luteoviolacea B = ATCC 29581]|nr:DNA polymerase IV [Pseudoalteromonas luteoviolacea B = ATCC 29581]